MRPTGEQAWKLAIRQNAIADELRRVDTVERLSQNQLLLTNPC
jgi:hypothetical protein